MKRKPQNLRHRSRRGAVLVVCLIALTAMFGFAALAIDLGHLLAARSETHRSADAAALAACWEFMEQHNSGATSTNAMAAARTAAATIAASNKIRKSAPNVDIGADVRFGYLDPYNRSAALDVGVDPLLINAVEVTVRRTSSWNGPVPTFFARVFGVQNQQMSLTSTAVMARYIKGFQTPNDGSNLDIMPFALDLDSWEDLLAGTTQDLWSWNEETGTVSSGPDGVYEVNLFPQGTGSPGNRGTVDIGSSNNSTNDIARQILHGVSPSDLAHHGGKLEFDENGELFLNGDTGISAGVKDELATIKGKPRIIPIFAEVHGPGNNAMYTIVRWAGVRIMEVKLTGSNSSKRVIIQPATVFSKGVIPSADVDASNFVYAENVALAR